MTEMTTDLIIKTDGGSRGNPGKAAWAFVVFSASTAAVLFENKHSIGIATNNEAEYQGFVASVEWLIQQTGQPNSIKPERITWQLDSKLVVEQLNKKWKIKEPRMATYAETAWELLKKIDCPYLIQHIPREQNKAADALVNQELDMAE